MVLGCVTTAVVITVADYVMGPGASLGVWRSVVVGVASSLLWTILLPDSKPDSKENK
jgi:hypothetical protein